MIGLVVAGDLTITECLARGGTGAVYKAVDPTTDRRVAIKIINQKSGPNDGAYRCFRNEILSLARITHPHAVRLYDWGRTPDGHWYIVMELIQGRSLDDLLRAGPLPLELGLKILDDVAAVLEEAHDLGIVHRDVKPANIMLQRVGEEQFVRLLDFGIALLTQQLSEERPSGTPAYMAPEQILGIDVDGRADIYALGVLAYECFGGRVPFDDLTPHTVMARQIRERPGPLVVRTTSPSIPPGLPDFVAQMLEKDPDQRPQSVREVRDRIAEFLSIYSLPATSTLSGLWPVSVADRYGLGVAVGAPGGGHRGPPDRPGAAPLTDGVHHEREATTILTWGFVLIVAVTLLTRPWTSEPQATDAPAIAAKTFDDVRSLAPAAPTTLRQSKTEPKIEAQDAADSAPAPFASPAQPKTEIRRVAAQRSLRVCYEILSGAELRNPQLFIDGRRRQRKAEDQCFMVSVREGRHRFTLIGDPGLRQSLTRAIGASTDGVFFLID